MIISIIQSQLFWKNPVQNRKHFETEINALPKDTDLVILPEMFTSGFTMQPKTVAETIQGESISLLKQLAIKNDIAICGSLVIKDNNNFYNRLVFVHPNGTIETYDKKHTFTLAGEHKVYTAGNKKLIVNFKGWKICPLICYDLRFPVWSRNTEDYDLLIYVANWPKRRIDAWQALLKARAIENMSYTIGVNRVGLDGNGIEYTGHSAVLDCLGKSVIKIPANKTSNSFVKLDKTKQDRLRKRLMFLQDRDAFNLL